MTQPRGTKPDPVTIVSLHIAIPLAVPAALDRRDSILRVLAMAGLRVSFIDRSTDVRMVDVGLPTLGDTLVDQLAPIPYKEHPLTQGPVYRVPIHFRPDGARCMWAGRDAPMGKMNACPEHGVVPILCEYSAVHATNGVLATGYIHGGPFAVIPACEACQKFVTHVTGNEATAST